MGKTIKWARKKRRREQRQLREAGLLGGRAFVSCRGCKIKFIENGLTGPAAEKCCSHTCLIKAGPLPLPTLGKVPRPQHSQKQLQSVSPPTRRKKQNNEVARRKNEPFFKRQEWLELRYRVLEKYGRQCMKCGRTSGEMHVDHIKPRSWAPTLALEFDNLQVLCRDCNLGKSNKSCADFRPDSSAPYISEPARKLLCCSCLSRFPWYGQTCPKTTYETSARETPVEDILSEQPAASRPTVILRRLRLK